MNSDRIYYIIVYLSINTYKINVPLSRKIHVKSLGKASTILNVPRTNMGFPAIILSFVGVPEGTCLIATGQKDYQ